MNREAVVNKIARDMLMAGLISEDGKEKTKFYLNLVWVAGYQYYSQHICQRKIAKFSRENRKLDDYDSIKEAAIKNKCHRNTIHHFLAHTRNHPKGYEFRYVETKNHPSAKSNHK